jgi:hypothetical protein
MKAEIPTSDGKIEVDFSEMEKRLGDKASVEMKRYFEELKTLLKLLNQTAKPN